MPFNDLTPGYPFALYDLVYRDLGERTLSAYLYQPRGPGPFPAVVCVHGGAWVSGDRSVTQALAGMLATNGIAVMAIDFRMAPQTQYPLSLVDINYATRWLKRHAAEFSIDPAAIGGFGVSSGGHLILLSAMRPFDARYASAPLPEAQPGPQPDARLAFVITCSGVLDPLARYRMAQAAGHADIIACHRAYFPSEEAMAESSPPLILQRGEPAELPPLLMAQGQDDPRLPPDTAERMARLYQAAGGQARAVVYPGMGHAVFEWGRAELQDLLQRSLGLVGQAVKAGKA